MVYLDEALRLSPSVFLALKKVGWLTQQQRYTEALAVLEQARRFPHGNPLTWVIDRQRIAGWDEIIHFLFNITQQDPA